MQCVIVKEGFVFWWGSSCVSASQTRMASHGDIINPSSSFAFSFLPSFSPFVFFPGPTRILFHHARSTLHER